jgi:hypothetical protein
MQRPDDAELINRAALALFRGAPNALLASECDALVAKSTARSWRRRGRAPVSVLRKLLLLLRLRCVECNELLRDLGIEIARREGEGPRRPRGFQIIADWDGTGIMRDRRNRLGRPRKVPR